MAALQQLFYCIRPLLDRMLGEGILMLVRMVKVSLDGCFAATILLYPAPTGQDARGGDPNASTAFKLLLRSNYSIISGPHLTEC